MSIARIGSIAMLVPGGIWAGIIVTYAVERTHLWAQMSVEQFAVDFRRSCYRADPLQPILAVVTVAGAVTFALSTSGARRDLSAVAGGLIVVVIIASIVLAEPINSQFRRRPEGQAPPEARRLRERWTRFHQLRTVLAIAALIALAIAAGIGS